MATCTLINSASRWNDELNHWVFMSAVYEQSFNTWSDLNPACIIWYSLQAACCWWSIRSCCDKRCCSCLNLNCLSYGCRRCTLAVAPHCTSPVEATLSTRAFNFWKILNAHLEFTVYGCKHVRYKHFCNAVLLVWGLLRLAPIKCVMSWIWDNPLLRSWEVRVM